MTSPQETLVAVAQRRCLRAQETGKAAILAALASAAEYLVSSSGEFTPFQIIFGSSGSAPTLGFGVIGLQTEEGFESLPLVTPTGHVLWVDLKRAVLSSI